MARPIKVAVIGGGCGALTAAYELSRPEHNGRFAITVYQEGWRLGGKGASGRGSSGRIEEHGLHIWLGYYDNAFRMMRECYADLAGAAGGRSPYGHWREAFTPEADIGLFGLGERGVWQRWAARFPPAPGLPGDPRRPGELLSLVGYTARTIGLLRTLLLDCVVESKETPAGPEPDFADLSTIDRILSACRILLDRGAFAGAAVLVEALGVLGAALAATPEAFDSAVVRLMERSVKGLRHWLEANTLLGDRHQYVWEIVDLVVAYLAGVVRFGLLTDPRGLDAIEDYDCREWLRTNGASERALQSPFVCGLYDLVLAFEGGDSERPSLSAGQGVRAGLRMFFTYRGAIFWRMRAGMGDVVFAPLYDVLRRRGVRFAFFHRLTNVGLAEGGEIAPGMRSHVESLTFDVQAETVDGMDYQPLVEVSGRPCWPSRPRYDLLRDGERYQREDWSFESHWDRRRAGEKTLKVTEDFDFVVLGVSIGAVPHVCREILARDERWRRMTREVKTVATQAFQIWLDEDVDQLGWRGPPYIVSAFVKPFDTWCDMAQVVPEEAWSRRPLTVVYFCGVLQDPPAPPADDDEDYPSRRTEEVRRSAADFLRGPVRHLWPQAYGPNGDFRWEILASDEATSGSARFSTQYWRANVNPSDRYVLQTPGSFRHRISPLDMTYDNLTIAGDWTKCGFNTGCVEAAVMSGLLAAHALSGAPPLDRIVGFDHP